MTHLPEDFLDAVERALARQANSARDGDGGLEAAMTHLMTFVRWRESLQAPTAIPFSAADGMVTINGQAQPCAHRGADLAACVLAHGRADIAEFDYATDQQAREALRRFARDWLEPRGHLDLAGRVLAISVLEGRWACVRRQ